MPRRRRPEECAHTLTTAKYRVGDPERAGIAVGTSTLHRGGEQRWFACPRCRRRCRTLHRPDASDAWECRLCHDLNYRSVQQAHQAERHYVILRWLARRLEQTNGDWDVILEEMRAMGTRKEMLILSVIVDVWGRPVARM